MWLNRGFGILMGMDLFWQVWVAPYAFTKIRWPTVCTGQSGCRANSLPGGLNDWRSSRDRAVPLSSSGAGQEPASDSAAERPHALTESKRSDLSSPRRCSRGDDRAAAATSSPSGHSEGLPAGLAGTAAAGERRRRSQPTARSRGLPPRRRLHSPKSYHACSSRKKPADRLFTIARERTLQSASSSSFTGTTRTGIETRRITCSVTLPRCATDPVAVPDRGCSSPQGRRLRWPPRSQAPPRRAYLPGSSSCRSRRLPAIVRSRGRP